MSVFNIVLREKAQLLKHSNPLICRLWAIVGKPEVIDRRGGALFAGPVFYPGKRLTGMAIQRGKFTPQHRPGNFSDRHAMANKKCLCEDAGRSFRVTSGWPTIRTIQGSSLTKRVEWEMRVDFDVGIEALPVHPPAFIKDLLDP